MTGRADVSPATIDGLARRLADLEAQARRDLGTFRAALREFAGPWFRETAKRVAVSQAQATMALGRERIAATKRAIEERIQGLEAAIAKEFTPERYTATNGASSGQVAPLIERRFETGIRRVLSTLFPVLEAAGYARDEHWLEVEPPQEPPRGRYRTPLELPPDIRDLIGKIVEALTEERVVEAKIEYFGKQREKETAARLWETS
jgi:nucleoid-associated protein YgaU